jgi:Flp pilus assembly protein TadB
MENLSDQTVQRMTQFLTTEHFTLQGARNATISEANGRLGHYIIEIAPEAEPYFSFPRFDDPEAVRQSMMPFHFRLQGLASTPGPIILINSVLVAAFAGILAVGFFSAGFGLAVLIAFLALGVGFVLHMLYSRRLWMEGERQLEVRFPSLQE